MRILALFIVLGMFYSGAVSAQTDTVSSSHAIGLGITGGTQGVGADVKLQVSKKFFVSGGYSTIPVKENGGVNLDNYTAYFTTNFNFSNVHVYGEWQLSRKSGFRLVGGVAWFQKREFAASMTPQGYHNYGYILLNSDDVGTLSMNIKWKSIAPYLGMGLGNAIPKNHRIGFSADLGCYYIGKPTVTATGTKLLSNTSDMVGRLNKNLDGYRWLPMLQLRISYKIVK